MPRGEPDASKVRQLAMEGEAELGHKRLHPHGGSPRTSQSLLRQVLSPKRWGRETSLPPPGSCVLVAYVELLAAGMKCPVVSLAQVTVGHLLPWKATLWTGTPPGSQVVSGTGVSKLSEGSGGQSYQPDFRQ